MYNVHAQGHLVLFPPLLVSQTCLKLLVMSNKALGAITSTIAHVA